MMSLIAVDSDWPGATFGIPSLRVRDTASDDHGYEVGYRKPPAGTRWKPGKSGNPSGKKKARGGEGETLGDILKDEWNQEISVSVKGRAQRMSVKRAYIKKLIQEGMAGDFGARRILAMLELKVRPQDKPELYESEASPEKDEEVMSALMDRLRRSKPERSDT